MASTLAFPDSVIGGPVNATNWFADNGLKNNSWVSTTSDPELAASTSQWTVAMPAGSTINGIEILTEIGGKGIIAAKPQAGVYNGSSWSTFQDTAGWNVVKYDVHHDPGWGSSSDLWGLSWGTSMPDPFRFRFDSSTMNTGGGHVLYVDYFKLRVTYTAAAAGYSHDVLGVDSGDISKVIGVATANISKVSGI